jgi:hypothetical protein
LSLILKIILKYTNTLHYLQSILIESVFTKKLKIPSWVAWAERPVGLIKVGGGAQALKRDLLGCHMEVENVSPRVNISN